MAVQIHSSLDRLYPPLAEIAKQVMADYAKMGLKVIVFETERTWDRQLALWRLGRNTSGIIVDPKKCVTWAAPGWSPHHYGLAFDVVFLDAKLRPTWSLNNPWFKFGAVCTKNKIEWGGYWTPNRRDLPHHQKWYRPLHINENIWYKTLRAEYWKNKNKEDVWKILDKRNQIV
jgi:hypothetical protein